MAQGPSTCGRKFISDLSCQRTASIGPLEWFGHGFVEIVNKGQHPLAEFLHRGETASFEEAPHQDAEPDFHLIQPRRMLWGLHKADAMTRILQEFGSAFHGR